MADEQFHCLAELQNGEFCMAVVGAAGERCAHHTRVMFGVRLCTATKKNGQPCSHRALPELEVCGIHNPNKAPRRAPAPFAREGQHSCDCILPTGTRRGQRCGRLATESILDHVGQAVRRSCANHREVMVRQNELRVHRFNWEAIINLVIERVPEHLRHGWQMALYIRMTEQPVVTGYDFEDEARAQREARANMLALYAVMLEERLAQVGEAPPPARRQRLPQLGTFATDTQNVHTPETRVMLQDVRDTLDGVQGTENSLEHIRACFETRNFHTPTIRASIYRDMKQWYDTATVSIPNDYAYRVMLDRVWALIQKSRHRADLEERLFEEAYDSLHMCAQGHIARLANVFQGFDENEAPVVEVSKGERLQTAMAQIAEMPEAEREAAARRVFAELEVDEAEQGPWMEALLA